MNRNMKIAFLFAVCAVSVVSFCGEAEAASGILDEYELQFEQWMVFQ